MVIHCIVCKKMPHELDEYVQAAELEGCTPAEIVADEEGTYNPSNGHFYCTECYFTVGMPLGKAP